MLKLAKLYLDNYFTPNVGEDNLSAAVDLLQQAHAIDGNAPLSSGAAAGAMLAEIYENMSSDYADTVHDVSSESEAELVLSAEVVGVANLDGVV